MQHSWHTMTALELGQKIAETSIDPLDLTKYFLDRIRDHDQAGSIYVRHTEMRALKEAEAARRRAKSGMTRSRLDGVPISWKDLYDTAGIPTEGGSPLLAGRTPT